MITAKIASIPERISQLELTVNFFLNHVDKLEVYLNNYPIVPVFLKRPEIQIFTSQENGDRGDVGKFYQVESARGYIFTIDDDLIYPPDYISTMIKKIDHYERKHLFVSMPIYYQNISYPPIIKISLGFILKKSCSMILGRIFLVRARWVFILIL